MNVKSMRADDGEFFSVQALLDPGSYSINSQKSSLDSHDEVNIVSYVSEEVANLIDDNIKKKATLQRAPASLLRHALRQDALYLLDA